MEAFLAIERILLVHHSTTRQPISLGALRFRTMKNGTPISVSDFSHILAVWPAAYSVSTVRGQQLIECADLPHGADRRRATFTELWQKKENMAVPTTPSPCSSRCGTPPPEPLLQRPATNTASRVTGRVTKGDSKRRVLMGTQKQIPGRNTSSASLLERIRAKEAKLRVLRCPQNLQRQTDTFLGSQVPKMKRILGEIVSSKDAGTQSFEIERMMEIMRENMVKLGDDELKRCLELLAQMHPSFCSIVTSGDTTFVRLTGSGTPPRQQQNNTPCNAAVEGPQTVAV